MDAYQIKLTDTEFEDMLDDAYDAMEVCGFVYAPGEAFRLVDPVAFRTAKLALENTGEWFCSVCATGYVSKDAAEICCQENTS